jgi:hypothetical protein
MDLFAQHRVIDVDTHVTEPPDLWTSRLPSKWQARAPHVERIRGRDFWMIDGKRALAPGAVGAPCVIWRSRSSCRRRSCGRRTRALWRSNAEGRAGPGATIVEIASVSSAVSQPTLADRAGIVVGASGRKPFRVTASLLPHGALGGGDGVQPGAGGGLARGPDSGAWSRRVE